MTGADNVETAKRRLFERLSAEIDDRRVLRAMESVPRELFVPEEAAHLAYEDVALPIGHGQSISQPYIVALTLSAARVRPNDRVLEVGAGSGYQAAVLSRLAASVVSVERVEPLARSAECRLRSLGYSNVEVRLATDALGWPDGAPYDIIVVAAGAPRIPNELLAQLAEGGRLVAPVGSMQSQELMRVVKSPDGLAITSLGACRFVPLVGPGAWPEHDDS